MNYLQNAYKSILDLLDKVLKQVYTFYAGEKTKNYIGTAETLSATAMAGSFYSLFAAQPLIPIGPTGPLLVFDEILFTVLKYTYSLQKYFAAKEIYL